MPRSRRGASCASRPPSPETTACTTEAVRPLAQAVTPYEPFCKATARYKSCKALQGVLVFADACDNLVGTVSTLRQFAVLAVSQNLRRLQFYKKYLSWEYPIQ